VTVNVVVLQGRLARPAEQRLLPSGSRLVSIEITVPGPPGQRGAEARRNRSERPDRAESAPVVWFDAPGWAADLDADTAVLVVGRVRRRFFRAADTTQSRVEVVAQRVVPVSSPRRIRSALAEVTAAFEAAAAN
jgi:single-stranded DNA-binding protein